MAGYGHPYVIHAANLVSRKALILQRVMVPPFQAAAQQQQQQQEPVRVAHEQVIDLVQCPWKWFHFQSVLLKIVGKP